MMKVTRIMDSRPNEYMYYTQLLKVMDDDPSRFFNGNLFYPRQFEIHLPGGFDIACNCHCGHCNGKLFQRAIEHWEPTGLSLLNKLAGKIPYHIYGGVYTEPTLNPYFMQYLEMTKRYNNHFGIHTNGILLKTLEENSDFLTKLCDISTDRVDYLSVSLDAGSADGWRRVKGLKDGSGFYEVLDGIRLATQIRSRSASTSMAIRMTYLLTDYSDTYEEIKYISEFARDVGIDSLRFSVPYDNYAKPFSELKKYHEEVELPKDKIYIQRTQDFISTEKTEIPYIFYTDTKFIDYTQFNFHYCTYGYYQITYAADGYAYKCSASAAPDSSQCRLGKITDDVDEFEAMILKNQNRTWDAQELCFAKNTRCNRMGIEINQQYEKWYKNNTEGTIDDSNI